MNWCSVTTFSKAFLTLKRRLWGKQVWAVQAKGHWASTKLERNHSQQALLGFMLLHHNFTKLSLSGLAHPFQASDFASVPPRPLWAVAGRGEWKVRWLLPWQGQLWLSPLPLLSLSAEFGVGVVVRWSWAGGWDGWSPPPSRAEPPEGPGHHRDAWGALLWHFLY